MIREGCREIKVQRRRRRRNGIADTRKWINRNSRIVEETIYVRWIFNLGSFFEEESNPPLSLYIYMHSHATFDTVPPGQGPLDPASAAGVSGRGSSWCDQLAGTFSPLELAFKVCTCTLLNVLTNAKLDAWYRINAPRFLSKSEEF